MPEPALPVRRLDQPADEIGARLNRQLSDGVLTARAYRTLFALLVAHEIPGDCALALRLSLSVPDAAAVGRPARAR
jgi:hypothetical protein